jgi:hypothetical protein
MGSDADEHTPEAGLGTQVPWWLHLHSRATPHRRTIGVAASILIPLGVTRPPVSLAAFLALVWVFAAHPVPAARAGHLLQRLVPDDGAWAGAYLAGWLWWLALLSSIITT